MVKETREKKFEKENNQNFELIYLARLLCSSAGVLQPNKQHTILITAMTKKKPKNMKKKQYFTNLVRIFFQ